MPNTLTVILGAGASNDLVPPGFATVTEDYQPPLTKDLFAGGNPLREEILQKYPDVETLATEIRYRIGPGKDESLEVVLRSLGDSNDVNVARHFRQVPLYLQELLGIVSDAYTTSPVNYIRLVKEVMTAHFKKVAFVTLNYDLLLDKAIEAHTGHTIGSFEDYVRPTQGWMLIKLHGSVNWARCVAGGMGGYPRSHEGVLSAVEELSAGTASDGPLKHLSNYGERFGGSNGVDLLYPAIAIPVQGKYGFVCPDEHVFALTEFLSSCEDFLVIGTSGKDNDLLDVLNNSIGRCSNYAIVGQADAESTYRQIRAHVPKLGASGVVYGFDGFTEFLREELLKFVRQTKDS